jgi:hypothetical protein
MKRLFLMAALLPTPALADELWCMPQTICRGEACVETNDEESSIRFADMDAAETTLRTHAEDVTMTRSETDSGAEWSGTNAGGAAESVIWTWADDSFTYTVTHADGTTRTASGTCEVQ